MMLVLRPSITARRPHFRLLMGLLALTLYSLLYTSPLWGQLSAPIAFELESTHRQWLRSHSGVQASLGYPLKVTERIAAPPHSSLRTLNLDALEQREIPSPEVWGDWCETAQGALLWRGVLRPAERGWHTLHLVDYALEEGDQWLVTDLSGQEIRGAFTANNNHPSGRLTIAPLYGDGLVIYYLPGSHERPAQLPWRLSGVTTALPSDELRHANGEPWFSLVGLECADAAVMHPEVEQLARSTVMIAVRGRTFGSGTLLNNSAQDGDALVLTAAHCLNRNYQYKGDLDYVRESAAQTLFYFNYASPTGSPLINGIQEQTLAGAELVAYNEKSDMCLLRITGLQRDLPKGQCKIPVSYRPYFAGWNARRGIAAPVVGLHYPKVSVVRYSQSIEQPKLSDYNVPLPVEWKGSHLLIRQWDLGTTASGSSGSGLFDRDGLVVGALSGGNSYCNSPYQDYYYAISETFQRDSPLESLAPHLSPVGSVDHLEGFDPYCDYPAHRLSHQLYRLSRDMITPRSTTEAVQGISVGYSLDTIGQLLGVIGVFDRMNHWPKGLELQVWSDEEGHPGQMLHRQAFTAPHFHKMGTTTSEQQYPQRTMSTPFQSYWPLESPLTLDSGRIYLALVAPPESDSLTLPLMQSIDQPHTQAVSWQLRSGAWQPAMLEGHSYLGHYWLDAIVRGGQRRATIYPTIDQPKLIIEGQRLQVILPVDWLNVSEERPPRLTLYRVTGEWLYSRDLRSTHNLLELPDTLAQSSVLLVRITLGQRSFVGKILLP